MVKVTFDVDLDLKKENFALDELITAAADARVKKAEEKYRSKTAEVRQAIVSIVNKMTKCEPTLCTQKTNQFELNSLNLYVERGYKIPEELIDELLLKML